LKRFAVLAILCLAFVALPASAAAATPEQRIAKLEKQIKQLKKQVTMLEEAAGFQMSYSACLAATTADAFRGTWRTLDQIAGNPVVGDQPAVADYESCSVWDVRRDPEAAPTSSLFSALLDIFR
jgi:hypothetical protein